MNPKEIVRKGYDAVGSKYTSTRHEKLIEMNFLPEFSKYIPPNGQVLDLGCGAGVPFTKYLSERFKVTGVDISPNQIELARNNVPNATFLCKDMTQLDFPEASFYGILGYYSIIHVPRDEHFKLFSAVFHFLKPGGVALMSLHRADDPEYLYDDYFGTNMYWSGFDHKTNLEFLKKVGFTIIWDKLVPDSLGDNKALFVLVQKPI
ncbi:MAG: class I SAM-dependent methyltransferase [Promethearchaeota archaeon]